MATITQRLDDRGTKIGWQAKIRKKGYPVQNKTFRTKAEAENWAKVTESEMVRGAFIDRKDAESTTLHEALARYAEEIIPRKKAGDREMGFLRQWQERPIAVRFLSAIRGKDIAEAIRSMESEGKSPNTIRLHLALVSHLYAVARREWNMESLSNPVELARKPKLPQGRDRRFVGNEEERLLAECDQSRNIFLRPVVIFALETAMRAGEIVETWRQDPTGAMDNGKRRQVQMSTGLLWEHVDLAKRTAHLPKTKNGDARTVPLSTKALSTLEALPRSRDGRVFR